MLSRASFLPGSIITEDEDLFVFDCEGCGSYYLFKDRDIWVTYNDGTYGAIPVALPVIDAGEKWENLVDGSSSIRY